MMGISKNGSRALCFVIDTTGSMSDDIAAVRETTSFIIDSKRGTPDEPSVYILVPFNDPGERWDESRTVSSQIIDLKNVYMTYFIDFPLVCRRDARCLNGQNVD